MATPAAPVADPSPPAPPSLPSQAPPDEALRAILSVARSLALLFAIVAGLLFLVFLVFGIVDLIRGWGPGDVVSAVYCLVSAAINYVLWMEIPRLEQLAAARDYAALRDRVLVWAVLGIVFFFVVGLLLLIAWLKAERLAARGPGPSA